jgi:hypothetical protein
MKRGMGVGARVKGRAKRTLQYCARPQSRHSANWGRAGPNRTCLIRSAAGVAWRKRVYRVPMGTVPHMAWAMEWTVDEESWKGSVGQQLALSHKS